MFILLAGKTAGTMPPKGVRNSMPIKVCHLPIIGLPYHEAAAIWPEMTGQKPTRLLKPRLRSPLLGLSLVPEEDNAEDAYAVRVEVAGHEMANGVARKIGYVPKTHAVAIRTLLSKARVLGTGIPDMSVLEEPKQGRTWFAQIQSDLLPSGLPLAETRDKPTVPLQIHPGKPTTGHPRHPGAKLAAIWF